MDRDPGAELNGYPLRAIAGFLADRLPSSTPAALHARIAELRARVKANTARVYVPLGETCGPAVRLKEAGVFTFGSGFFDNLVVELDDATELIRRDFAGVLRLGSLRIGRWEDQDSVFDDAARIFFHHYFHLPGEANEKSHLGPGGRRRRIDEADIPLFLTIVAAQFEYLAEKFRQIARSPAPKVFVARDVSGRPFAVEQLNRLRSALLNFGAVNFEVQAVAATPAEGHLVVPETTARWGDAAAWAAAFGRPPS